MNVFLIVIELFLLFLCAVCVFAIVDPGDTVEWTKDRYVKMLKFYGFEATIEETPRSRDIIRYGHMGALAVAICLMIAAWIAF